MNKLEEDPVDEIDSYELNDEDFNQNSSQQSRSSTLLMDRFGNESPDEMDESFFRNRKPSTGWLLDSGSLQENVQKPFHQRQSISKGLMDEDEENFITELDVNSDQITQSRLSVIDSRKEEESLSSVRSSSRKSSLASIKNKSQNLINDLPTLLDQDDLSDLPHHISQNALTIEQLNNITKRESSSLFMLDKIDLSLLAKFLVKENSSNEIEKDVTWTYDSLITELSDFNNS